MKDTPTNLSPINQAITFARQELESVLIKFPEKFKK